MRSREIKKIVGAVEQKYGKVALYNEEPEDGHGICFKINGIPATFSIHTQDGKLSPGHFDIQIEGVPPGDYIFTKVVSLLEFLEFVSRTEGPEEEWPNMHDEES